MGEMKSRLADRYGKARSKLGKVSQDELNTIKYVLKGTG